MEYRKIGHTNMEVSQLSFGASSLGGVFRAVDEQEAIKAVLAAVDQGMNFIDVSPYYGFYRAEEVLGKALRQITRDKYYISTKVGRYGLDGKKAWDYSASRAKSSVDESLKRLGLDFVDLINVHDLEFADLQQVIEETIPALQEVRIAGKARYIGITGLPLDKLKYVIEKLPAGSIDTILSFCHYSLNDNALVDYLDFFKSNKIGVINASPLSMGLLTRRGAPDWHPASERLKSVARKAVEVCNRHQYPIEQLAIKYSVSHPGIATTLVSSANPDNIIRNVEWAEAPQNDALLQEVLEILQPVHRETWDNS